MTAPNRYPIVIGLLLVCVALARPASSQESLLAGVSADTVTPEQIETAIASVQAQEDLDDATRASVVDQLQGALAQLTARAAAESAAAGYAEALDTAPAEAAALRAQLEQPQAPAPTAEALGIRDTTPLADVEQTLARAGAELAAAESRLAYLEQQVQAQAARPAEIRARIAELRDRRAALDEALAAAPPSDQPLELTEARRLLTELRRDRLIAEVYQLEQELLSHAARLDLLRAERDVAARNLAARQRAVVVIQQAVNDKRQDAAALARQAAVLTELAAEGKHPVIRQIAIGNAELTRELPAIAAGIEQSTEVLAEIQASARRLEQAIARTEQRLEIAGVSQAIGRLLVEERRNLPQVSQYRAEVSERRRRLADIGLAQVRIEEQRRELTPIDDRLDALMSEVAQTVGDPAELEEIRTELRQLLVDRRALLDQAAGSYTTYLQVLGDLDVAQRRLLDLGADYKTLLDENMLWIPSAEPVGATTFRNLAPAVAWMLRPTAWAEAAMSISASAAEHRAVAVLLLLVLALLLAVRGPLTRRLRSINERIGRAPDDNILQTLAALGIVAVRALPLPYFLALVGLALVHSPRQFEFAFAFGQGLHVVVPFLYNVSLFRDLFRANGVVRRHFLWDAGSLAVTRRQFDRLMVIGAPLILVAATAYWSPVLAYRESLGRLTFVVLMAVFAAGLHPLMHPVRGVIGDYYRRTPAIWTSRLRWVWYVLTVGSPLLLGLMAVAGYLYTAATLTGKLIDAFWVLLALLVVDMVALRWLALARRKLARQVAVEQREAEADVQSPPGEEQAPPVIESVPLDLDAVDKQSQRLLRAGLFLAGVLALWAIWADVLPALGALEEVGLWSQTVTVDGVETILPVTLADLLFALVVIGVTVIAARNLPGLMEIAILQRMSLQAGSRYAATTIVRYVVITVGLISVLNIVGWNWSQIQWLVAALSVGLGFGLQEIVANFVSGLIILFERPVRVGDTVTVGQLTGTVSRVQIRATTITDWDRKEILVPNKNFITSEVINWTLSDPITRIVIPVGISYGSDVLKAEAVMRDTLARLPLVLDEPASNVYFVGFGESSLDFKLYVYSRELSDRLPLTHAVHREILAALRDNGIEIPFPQRDLHLRSIAEEAAGRLGGDDAQTDR